MADGSRETGGLNLKDKLKSLIGSSSAQSLIPDETGCSSALSPDFWRKLSNLNHGSRIRLLVELKVVMKSKDLKRSDIERIWVTTNDLLDSKVLAQFKSDYVNFLVSLINCQFHKIETFRPIILDKVVEPHTAVDVEHQVLVVSALTGNGKLIDPLETEVS